MVNDSQWGFDQTSIAAPLDIRDGGWAITHFQMVAPGSVVSGQWAFAGDRIRAAHLPVGTYTPEGVRYTDIHLPAP